MRAPFLADNRLALKAVAFDRNTTASRAAFVGATPGKKGTFHMWFRRISNILDGSSATLFASDSVPNSRFKLTREGDNKLSLEIFRSDLTTDALAIQTNNAVSSGAWHSVLSSWDMAVPGSGRLYVDDVSDYHEFAYDNFNLAYDYIQWSINYGNSGPTFHETQDVACIWLDTTTYIDFSLEGNRRKFISKQNKPLSLGSNGSFPTGTAPICYQTVLGNGVANDILTNRGTGGNFTLFEGGPLALAGTSPSD